MSEHISPPPRPVRVRPVINFDPDEGRTQQSFAKDADINNIMNQYAKTGQITLLNPSEPAFGFAPSETYQESLNLVNEAQNLFDALPSAVRRRFKHDPADFLEFALDEKNLTEMADLGLLTPEAAAAALVAAAATETIISPPAEPDPALPDPPPPE